MWSAKDESLDTMSYDPASFWGNAARHMQGREGDVEIASDSTPVTRYKRLRFLRQFLDQMPIEGRSILEVGCGPGGNLAALASRGGATQLMGVDIAKEMVALAQQRLGDQAEVRLSAGGQLPLKDQEVDLAFTSTVLMHNLDDADASQIIDELCRVAGQTVWLIEDTASERRQRAFHVRRTPEWYAAEVERRGFAVEKIDHIPLLASRAMAAAINRVARGQDRGRGMPQPTWARVLEGGLLPITRLFDPWLPSRAVLTRVIATR